MQGLSGASLRALWGDAEQTLLGRCAPCQPFSSYSRKGRGTRKDGKWGLVAHFGRLIQESQPDFVTMENVPQLLDHDVFGEFVACLEGYHSWWSVIQCADYGVPQTRKRLVLSLKSRHVQLIPPAGIESGQNVATVRSAVSHLPALSAGDTDPNDQCTPRVGSAPSTLSASWASVPGGTWRDWDPSSAACHRKECPELRIRASTDGWSGMPQRQR